MLRQTAADRQTSAVAWRSRCDPLRESRCAALPVSDLLRNLANSRRQVVIPVVPRSHSQARQSRLARASSGCKCGGFRTVPVTSRETLENHGVSDRIFVQNPPGARTFSSGSLVVASVRLRRHCPDSGIAQFRRKRPASGTIRFDIAQFRKHPALWPRVCRRSGAECLRATSAFRDPVAQ